MRKLFLFLSCGWILTLAILFQNCSSSDDGPSGPAKMMFINGITGSGALTVVIEDSSYSKLLAGFGNFTLYNEITSGNQNFKLKDNANGNVVTSRSFNISGQKNYSLMAVGSTLIPELIIKEDDLNITDTTKSYIRLINLSSNSNAMKLSITNGSEIVSGINYKGVSDFITIDPARYDMTVVSGSTVVSTITNFNLLRNKKYSILITGLVNQTPRASHNIIVNK